MRRGGRHFAKLNGVEKIIERREYNPVPGRSRVYYGRRRGIAGGIMFTVWHGAPLWTFPETIFLGKRVLFVQ